jgi:hypothetical protein
VLPKVMPVQAIVYFLQSQLLCMLQQETQVQSNEEGEEGSERLDKADGRWDFAKILAQDA